MVLAIPQGLVTPLAPSLLAGRLVLDRPWAPAIPSLVALQREHVSEQKITCASFSRTFQSVSLHIPSGTHLEVPMAPSVPPGRWHRGHLAALEVLPVPACPLCLTLLEVREVQGCRARRWAQECRLPGHHHLHDHQSRHRSTTALIHSTIVYRRSPPCLPEVLVTRPGGPGSPCGPGGPGSPGLPSRPSIPLMPSRPGDPGTPGGPGGQGHCPGDEKLGWPSVT